MKITKVIIDNMHKTHHAEYNMHDFTYLHGANGAGKSTVLQAIQLALLGYIPNFGKTNAAIMAHANATAMSVRVEFDTGDYIERKFTMNGSAKQSIDTSITDLESLLGNAEMPVIRFSDFMAMTANKLKDWFIGFLPYLNTELDWGKELIDAVFMAGISVNPDEVDLSIIEEFEEFAKNSAEDPMEQTRALNAHLKECRSAEKYHIDRIQKTVESLIYYDDDVTASKSPDEVREEQKQLALREKTLRKRLADSDFAVRVCESVKSQMDALKIAEPAESMESDLEYQSIIKQIEEYERDRSYYEDKIAECEATIFELDAKISRCNFIVDAPDLCPYCHIACAELDSQRQEYLTELKELEADREEFSSRKSELLITFNRSKELLQVAKLRKQNFERLYSTDIPKYQKYKSDILSQSEITEIQGELDTFDKQECELEIQLSKLLANKRYEDLTETITKERILAEKRLELIGVWIKLTDVNGMQTRLMQEPFDMFGSELQEMLHSLFPNQYKSIEPKFVVDAKANSFEFGLIRDGEYTPYASLSSGEKCKFALALLSEILCESSSRLKLIIMDDMMDHLDEVNAGMCFEAMHEICRDLEIQVISAGVIPCDCVCSDDIVVHVGGSCDENS